MVSINGDYPNSWIVYFMENPKIEWFQLYDLGVPLFQESSIYHITIVLWVISLYPNLWGFLGMVIFICNLNCIPK